MSENFCKNVDAPKMLGTTVGSEVGSDHVSISGLDPHAYRHGA